jgi:ABC-type Fe3+ transport system substrate-binding protein
MIMNTRQTVSGKRRLNASFKSVLPLIFLLVGADAAGAQERNPENWDAIVKAANEEGRIVIAGPQSSIWNGALETFGKEYPQIKVEVTPFIGNDFWPRLQKEREVGRNLWDIRVGGMDASVWKLKAAGALAPVRPLLITPEASNEKNWRGGFQHMYLDKANEYFPTFCAQASDSAAINRNVIPESEIKLFSDILNPKWKGKLVIADPRGGSAAISTSIIYHKYGEDAVRKLLVDQAPVFAKNPRQIIDWFESGKYPIAIGISTGALDQFKKNNVQLNIGEISDIKIWSPGVCGVMLPNPRPHPNATTVFLNWLFSEKGQKAIMPIVKLNSRRTTVEPLDIDRVIDYARLDTYISGQTEELQQSLTETRDLVRKLLP